MSSWRIYRVWGLSVPQQWQGRYKSAFPTSSWRWCSAFAEVCHMDQIRKRLFSATLSSAKLCYRACWTGGALKLFNASRSFHVGKCQSCPTTINLSVKNACIYPLESQYTGVQNRCPVFFFPFCATPPFSARCWLLLLVSILPIYLRYGAHSRSISAPADW